MTIMIMTPPSLAVDDDHVDHHDHERVPDDNDDHDDDLIAESMRTPFSSWSIAWSKAKSRLPSSSTLH